MGVGRRRRRFAQHARALVGGGDAHEHQQEEGAGAHATGRVVPVCEELLLEKPVASVEREIVDEVLEVESPGNVVVRAFIFF